MESVSVVAGSSGSIAARSLPRGEIRPDVANARTFAGTPSMRSPGMLCMPLCQIEACASVGDVIEERNSRRSSLCECSQQSACAASHSDGYVSRVVRVYFTTTAARFYAKRRQLIAGVGKVFKVWISQRAVILHASSLGLENYNRSSFKT